LAEEIINVIFVAIIIRIEKMRKLLIALSLMLPLLASCEKDEPKDDKVEDVCEKITDKNFKSYVYANFDKDGDGVVSRAEADAVKAIKINSKNITSVDGIATFTKLETLEITETSITTLDLSKNTALLSITIKDCTYLGTVTLGALTNLDTLVITGTKVSSLDLSKLVNLLKLDCSKNSLTTLDITKNTKLNSLDCSLNSIETLDISKNILLESVECFMPSLKEIIVNKEQYSKDFFKSLLELDGVKINMA